jgi:hypothetical protein
MLLIFSGNSRRQKIGYISPATKNVFAVLKVHGRVRARIKHELCVVVDEKAIM